MSVHHTLEQGYTSRVQTPPPILAKRLLLVQQLPRLSEQQLREFLDRTIRDDCDIRHFYEVMIDAIRSNKVYLVNELLQHKMPVSPIYVLEAVKARAKTILTSFFNNGWDINTSMSRTDPPILANALEDPEMTTWLLDHGADPNTRCDIDNTPLSYAARYAALSTIDLLLRRGGDVRIGQLVRNAIYRESDSLKVVEMLVDRGAPFNALMYEDHQYSRNMFPFMRETPLHTAVALKKGDVIRYLVHKGASVDIEDCRGQTVMQSADEDTRRVIIQEIQN
ncbi:hypothetical protein CBS147333_488 [Penicillium roqueforti]|uniref:uncharacterized protein n=1 Tax=Penicillium roqueforti TaxID=5082 RepID=UPI00190A5C86|nr:uncharacterized protein LCP9604111_2155 [Penicillium roqueforti]KAF9252159.1 hypothetical protein LCP9604111_2155 [Penicillium roqueforti]KAI2687866.1 hypothetical protein LCP963914a_3384 [Penicillium roqueforti]KAI2689756.1 hypothetical protein CBS147355_207 [Penicillium roqueforti]KAI3116864.1 hypothetical protein CBS147333_488 [Penicillium roqueforti]KAI3272897.1 hypothetical protein CBS147308_3517 [Penicillium roqueforti]